MAKQQEVKTTKKKQVKEVSKKEVKEVEPIKEAEEKKEEVKEQSTLTSVIELIGIVLAIIVVLVFFPNTVIWNIVVLLLILTVLIFVHELGHFIIAKKCGVHVYEFALGMGPKVLGFKRKNDPTEYNLRAFPIGGFCQMAGEEGEDDKNLSKDKFMCNKSKIQRICILVAGVTMNFITAIVLLFIIGLSAGSTEQRSFIGRVEKDTPAYESGLVKGDRIIKLNGHKVSTWDEVQLVSLLKNKNKYNSYVVEHKDGTVEEIKIVPIDTVQYEGKTYKITKENTKEEILKELNIKETDAVVSKIIGVTAPSERKKGIKASLKYAGIKFVSTVKMMYKMVGALITGKLGLDNLSGPVGMYSVVGTVAKAGFINILFLMAYLSINLGVLNIIPFPAFDGGRVLFIIIEAIIGKKVSPEVEGWFHSVGFFLLMLLMLYITIKDVINLF